MNVMIVKKPPSKGSNATELETFKGAVKIIDFGLSIRLPDHVATIPGKEKETLSRHHSPERLRGEPYNEKDDVWAVGYLFAKMVTGPFINRLPDCGTFCTAFPLHPDAVSAAVKKVTEISPKFGKIVAAILQAKDAHSRPTAAEVLLMVRKALAEKH